MLSTQRGNWDKQIGKLDSSQRTQTRQNLTGIVFRGGLIVAWFDLETCSKVIKDGAIGQNTYDFLLVFYSNCGRISYRFCASVNFIPK